MKAMATLAMMFFLGSPAAFAMHTYAYYECSNKNLELKYDGPGSNYAIGGFSNFYSENANSPEPVKVLSQQNSPDSPAEALGSETSEGPLELIFSVLNVVKTSHVISDLKVGDSCNPDEFDYQHKEWTSVRMIQIKDLAAPVVAKLGLRKGDVLHLSCQESLDIPVKCPASGKYENDDLK